MHNQTNQKTKNKDSQVSSMANFSLTSSIQSIERLFWPSRSTNAPHTEGDPTALFTPLDEAVAEIRRRRNNPELVSAVQIFLNNDIPEHFNGTEPIFYLSRHVATPNYETLRFIEIGKLLDLPTVIGQDPKDKFVSNNILKRNLGKMPVTKGVSHTGDEIIECFNVVDFKTAQGAQIKDVKTRWGDSLINFHNSLLHDIYQEGAVLADESAWLDRNHRGNIYQNYVKLLSLQLVHGIMFEFYEPEDAYFVEQYLKPAFKVVEQQFGIRPLIVNLIEPEIALEKNWNGYPSIVYQHVKMLIGTT